MTKLPSFRLRNQKLIPDELEKSKPPEKSPEAGFTTLKAEMA
jgi:hypothetical protein